MPARSRARSARISRSESDSLQSLERSLRQRDLHGRALEHDLRVRRDLERDVLIAELGDAADQAARGDHFIAKLGDQYVTLEIAPNTEIVLQQIGRAHV